MLPEYRTAAGMQKTLVDEGTSALDEENANIVEESLLGNPERTLILVSHHLAPERKFVKLRYFLLVSTISLCSLYGKLKTFGFIGQILGGLYLSSYAKKS